MVHGPIMETQKRKRIWRYLFWTSVDTDKVGANKQIPVIISTADGKFYISSSTTARKQKSSAYKPYVAIAPTGNGNSNQYKSYIAGKEPYNTLEDAYKAYADVVKMIILITKILYHASNKHA